LSDAGFLCDDEGFCHGLRWPFLVIEGGGEAGRCAEVANLATYEFLLGTVFGRIRSWRGSFWKWVGEGEVGEWWGA
jgi:hypothetical protein